MVSKESDTHLQKLFALLEDIPEFECRHIDSVHARSRLGNTPLHIAAIWGDREAVITLLEAGADVNAVGEDGYTPLHEAIEQGHMGIATLLISQGALVDMKNNDGLTPSQLNSTVTG